MSTINGHTTRAVGTVLTASIYNTDHLNHVTNAQTLNTDKMEGTPPPVVDGHVVVWNGTLGNAVRTGGFVPANKAGDTFTGAVIFNSTIAVTGAVTFSSTLGVTGAITGNGGLKLEQNGNTALEIRSNNGGTPFIDFSNDNAIDFDVRVILTGDDLLDIQGVSNTGLLALGNVVWHQGNVGAQINASTEDTTPDKAADFVLTYDASASTQKKVLLNKLGGITKAGPTTLSGTSIDFTGIPSGVKRLVVTIDGASANLNNSSLIIQLGDSGGIETTGYTSITSAADSSTVGLIMHNIVTATDTVTGIMILELHDVSGNIWVGGGHLQTTTPAYIGFTGKKATSAVLDRIRITTGGGTATFDAGTVSLSYE